MEEREVHCSGEHPLIGWRLFRVRRSEVGFVLTAPLIHDPDFEQFPSANIEAVCYDGEHSAPAPGCRCGLYAAIDGTLDSLSGYLRDSAHDTDSPVFAEVACTGRVFVDARGVRAERIAIRRLAMSESDWPDADRRTAVARQLRQRYGLDVRGIDIVPRWVHANNSPQGAPSEADAARVDLDQLIARITASPSAQEPRHHGSVG